MHPPARQRSESFCFPCFSFSLYSSANTRYGGWILERYPPTRETFRWTTAADRGLFFLDPGLFLVSRMMFYDLNDGYTPGMRRVSFLFSFLANQFYLPA